MNPTTFTTDNQQFSVHFFIFLLDFTVTKELLAHTNYNLAKPKDAHNPVGCSGR